MSAQIPLDLLTDEQIAIMLASPAEWSKVCILIENKEKELIPFNPNAMQVQMSAVYETMQALGRPTRIIVLKPRQSGGSTFSTIMTIHHAKRYRARGVFMADDLGNSRNLYAMAERHCQTDAFPWGVEYTTARGEIIFSNGSLLEQDTANNPKAGISATRQIAHMSEVCKYPNDGVRDSYTTITNMMASLNKEGKNSLAILESTPDTPAGYFYDQWQKAVTLDEFMSGNEGNGWVKVFTPWHAFESHRMEITEGQRADILTTLNEVERDGVKKYGWTPEQIAWRRMTLQTDCGGDERMFSVHYPADELTCWLSAGSPRFDMDGVNAIEQVGVSQMVPQYGWLTGEDSTMVWSARAENEAGLIMYEQPLDGHRYLLAIDPATGARNTRGADPDCHGFRVLRAGYRDELGRAHPIKVVMAAKHPCRWDIDVLAKVAIRVCKYYGGCLIVPERNMGLALIEYLRNGGVPLYQDEVIDHLTSKTKSIIGWETNRENRVRCIERLATLIRESSLDSPKILLDPWTIEELKTFVRDAKGHAAAAPGKHDDNVMAVAIGVTCMESATTLMPLVRRKGKPRDYDNWKHVK